MEKIKAFLTQKLNKNSFNDVNVKRAIKLTLCGASIVAMMIQAISCFITPMSAYAANGYQYNISGVPSLPVDVSDNIVDTDAVIQTNGETLTGIIISPTGITYGSIQVYNGTTWINSAYREIVIYNANDLVINWLDDNSTVTEFITLKAGTYRFNNVLTETYPLSQSLDFSVSYDGQSQSFVRMVTSYGDYFALKVDNGSVIDVLYVNPVNSDFVEYYPNGWLGGLSFDVSFTVDQVVTSTFGSWFISSTNYNEVNSPSLVYDFTGETRIFNSQLTTLPYQTPTVTNVYSFNFNVWNGANADAMIIQETSDQATLSYSFSDDGAGGVRTVYRQTTDGNTINKTWIYPRTRVITFQSNPDDPDFQQWLLDNTQLVDLESMEIGYNTGYDQGYNDGWTNSAIGDTLKAPVDALNNIVLLETAHVTITLGGVIFTMVVLSIMLIFLKKYAGG